MADVHVESLRRRLPEEKGEGEKGAGRHEPGRKGAESFDQDAMNLVTHL
jgi:hypothetical protein